MPFDSNPEVIRFGIEKARTSALFFFLLAYSHSISALLRGSGKVMIPMAVMLAVWCVFRISYITFMVPRFQDITVVFTAYPITWSISSILFALTLWKGNWMSMRV